jgi:hypothetical protein
MALQLAPEEPEAGPWRTEPLAVLVRALTQRVPGEVVSGRPVIVAIDGRSNSGQADLGTGRRHRVRYAADAVRPEHRSRRRVATRSRG